MNYAKRNEKADEAAKAKYNLRRLDSFRKFSRRKSEMRVYFVKGIRGNGFVGIHLASG